VTTEEKHALLRERLHALNIVCGGDATGKLIRYQELLETWNARINLTGAAAFDALLDKHLMDSLTPLTVDGLLPENATVIDVGSGAGLPGIPLAIVRSDLRMTLLDSMQKRIGFLNTVIETLGLTNVTATHTRAEDAAHDEQYREQFDIAIARAVAALPVLEELLLPFVRIGGKIVCYKGPSVKEELEAGAVAAELLGGGLPEGIAVSVPFLPQHRHTLTVTKKLRLTLKRYPRKAGTPAKNPLGS
jgi:16S rRNA (guanine527-N7)-methyltransferase